MQDSRVFAGIAANGSPSEPWRGSGRWNADFRAILARRSEKILSAAGIFPCHLAEGNRRRGKDRTYLWSVAAGSADEVRTGLRTAVAWGYLSEESVSEVLEELDHLLAIVWKLMN